MSSNLHREPLTQEKRCGSLLWVPKRFCEAKEVPCHKRERPQIWCFTARKHSTSAHQHVPLLHHKTLETARLRTLHEASCPEKIAALSELGPFVFSGLFCLRDAFTKWKIRHERYTWTFLHTYSVHELAFSSFQKTPTSRCSIFRVLLLSDFLRVADSLARCEKDFAIW